MKVELKKLSEIANIDISSIDKKIKLGEENVKLCNFTDVYYNWAITKDMESEFMVASASKQNIERFLLKKGQVAITKDSETRNDIGIPTYIADDFQDTVLGYHCALITPNEDIVDGAYLNAYLSSRLGRKYFENQASGSGQRYTLTLDAIGSVGIYLPSIEIQKRIGKFFSNIDKRIKNNTALNAELESMAKALYDYWFLQFEFPNEEGKTYKSSGGKMVWNEELGREIPEGWEVTNLKNKYSIERGISYTSKDIESGVGKAMINLASIDTQRNYKPGELKFYNGKLSKKNILEANDMLIACTDMTRNADIVGSPILVPNDGQEYTYSMDMAKIQPLTNRLNKYYLYMLLRTDFYHDYIKNWASGTNVLHLNLDGLDWYKTWIPPIELQEKFAEIVIANHDKRCEIIKENQELTSLRDFLLPLLMNGQVGFKEEE